MNWAARLSTKQKDLLSIAAILCIFLVRFFKTIFLAQPISRLFLLAHWDSLFYNLRSGNSFSMDISVVQLFMPYIFLVADYWHHGVPLWNQWSGFGMPLLADPQAFVLSPLYAVFVLFKSMHTWNIILVAELIISAISTYLLCRELELDYVAASIAACLFAFCPWLHWQLELLGTGSCFTPFVFLFFGRLAKKGSLKNIVLAAIAGAADILSCHPEVAFVTVSFASIFTCFITHYNEPTISLISSLRNAMRCLFLTALITLGFCAPMFIPFLEYAMNADSYKLDTITSVGLSWQAILANWLFPFQSAQGSMFFGPSSILGIVASLCFFKYLSRFAKPLIICLVISLLGVIRPFPFDILFKIPPFSMTPATYWLPEYFLFISMVSGLGCSYLVKHGLPQRSLRTLIYFTLTVTLLLIPLVFLPWHRNCLAIQFDSTFELPKFNSKVWLLNAICGTAALSVLVATFNKSPRWKFIGSSFFVSLGLLNLFITSLGSLPIRPDFQYPKILPLNLNTDNISDTDRILSIGDHLFRPNTNLVYKLPMIQTTNPIFPKGFIDFSKACGAQTDPYTIFPPLMSPLLKIAGANIIISQQPILDATVLENQPQSLKDKNTILQSQIKYSNSITLSNIQLLYDKKGNALFLVAKRRSNTPEIGNYHLCLSVEDSHGNSVSYSEPVLISSSYDTQEVMCSGLIPKNLKHWTVSIRMMRDKDCYFLRPEYISCGNIRSDNSWLLATSDEPQHFTEINNDRFRLIAQQGSILKYQDLAAFKRYFFIENIVWMPNRPEALNYLKAHPNELDNMAVLEQAQKAQFITILKSWTSVKLGNTNLSSIAFDKFSTVRKLSASDNHSTNPNVSLSVEAKSPSFLVASDIYYPGWEAYIDGQKSKIFRTDSLFRGILVPAGKHLIKFVYQPTSVLLGLVFLTTTLLTLAMFCLPKKLIPKQLSGYKKILPNENN